MLSLHEKRNTVLLARAPKEHLDKPRTATSNFTFCVENCDKHSCPEKVRNIVIMYLSEKSDLKSNQ